MLKKIVLAAFFVGGLALPALAQGATCTAPTMPPPVDPAKATVDQIRGVLTAAQGFIAASDVYQSCLGNEVQAEKDQAKRDSKPFDASIETAMDAKAAANQKDKEKIGADANAAITAFKKVHACEGKQLSACQ